MSEFLLELPQNNFQKQEGGLGYKLTFNDLALELFKAGHITEDEILSQVNITEDGIILYTTKMSKRGGNG